MMNDHYERKFRTQAQPATYNAPRHRRSDQFRRPKKRRSLLATLLMIVGAVTLFVLLMRYAIVPLLVLLPNWLGGIA